MLKKILLLSAALLFITAGGAHAQDADGYADDDTVVVSDTTVVPGQSVTASARTFMPGSPVTFTLFSQPITLGTVDANSEGVATITFTMPDVPAGEHTLRASGTGDDGAPLTVDTTLTVVGAGASARALPTTGSDGTISTTQVGLAALVVGGLLVLAAQKRRSNAAARATAGV